jgi:response regulator RpfG family c-di-GMP phosphodiesterase
MNRDQAQSVAATKQRLRDDNELPAKAHEVLEQARNSATKRVESVRHTAEVARAEAAEKVRKFGQVVRKIGEHMRIEEQTYIADHANSAGQHIDTVADYIDGVELNTLVQDAEDLSKRQPVLWFSGAVLLGVVAGRFLKSPAA